MISCSITRWKLIYWTCGEVANTANSLPIIMTKRMADDQHQKNSKIRLETLKHFSKKTTCRPAGFTAGNNSNYPIVTVSRRVLRSLTRRCTKSFLTRWLLSFFLSPSVFSSADSERNLLLPRHMPHCGLPWNLAMGTLLLRFLWVLINLLFFTLLVLRMAQRK